MSLDSRVHLVYVSKQRIRQLFNEGRYWIRARNREFTLEYLHNKPAPREARQVRGTKSQIVAYFDSNGEQVALVHQYVKPDGTLGGSGKPDPKELRQGDVLYKIDYGDID
jgi:hypothetical protein